MKDILIAATIFAASVSCEPIEIEPDFETKASMTIDTLDRSDQFLAMGLIDPPDPRYFPQNTIYRFDQDTLPEYLVPYQISKRGKTWGLDSTVISCSLIHFYHCGRFIAPDGHKAHSGIRVYLKHDPGAWMGFAMKYKTTDPNLSIAFVMTNETQGPRQDIVAYTEPHGGALWAEKGTFYVDKVMNLTKQGSINNHSWSKGDVIRIDIYPCLDDRMPTCELLIDYIALVAIPDRSDVRRWAYIHLYDKDDGGESKYKVFFPSLK